MTNRQSSIERFKRMDRENPGASKYAVEAKDSFRPYPTVRAWAMAMRSPSRSKLSSMSSLVR